MSHFSVLVITKEDPMANPDALAAALQPFHEVECTGVFDQYVQDLDETEEHRENWATQKREFVFLPNGQVLRYYTQELYTPATAEERAFFKAAIDESHPFRSIDRDKLPEHLHNHTTERNGHGGTVYKVWRLPEGAVTKEVSAKDAGISFKDWLADELCDSERACFFSSIDQVPSGTYNYVLLDADAEPAKVVRRTNPNKKWDWWTVGGRYSGRLFSKAAYCEEQDSLRRSDLDIENMLARRRADKVEQWEAARKAFLSNQEKNGIVLNLEFETALKNFRALDEKAKKDVTEQFGEGWTDAKREAYRAILNAPENKNLSEVVGPIYAPFFGELSDETSLEELLAKVKFPLSAFAVLDVDGTWRENGEMGWWGISFGETMTDEEWATQVGEFVLNLAPELYLTVVDCHI